MGELPAVQGLTGWRRAVFAALVVGLLGVGVGLRGHHLETFPRHNQTADEYAWTWAGMTLWTEGAPRSWSWLPSYKGGENITWRGNTYRLVKPWVDHPPLFAAVQGLWMLANGQSQILEVDLRVMRRGSVVLWALGAWLLVLLGVRLLGHGAALLALLTYATASPVVFNSRLVVSENLVVPLLLGAHLSLLNHLQQPQRRRWLVVLGLLTLCLPVTKLPAVCCSFALLALAWSARRWSSSITVGAATVAGVGAYALWGVVLAGGLFLETMASHKNKFSGFGGFSAFVLSPRVVEVVVPHFPFLLAFLLACHALLRRDEGRAGEVHAAIPAVVYPLCMTFLVVEGQVYGWYQLPVYPYYALLLGGFLQALMRGRLELGFYVALTLMMPQLSDRSVEFGWASVGTLRVVFAALALGTPLLSRLPGMARNIPVGVATGLLVAWMVAVDVTYVWRH